MKRQTKLELIFRTNRRTGQPTKTTAMYFLQILHTYVDGNGFVHLNYDNLHYFELSVISLVGHIIKI